MASTMLLAFHLLGRGTVAAGIRIMRKYHCTVCLRAVFLAVGYIGRRSTGSNRFRFLGQNHVFYFNLFVINCLRKRVKTFFSIIVIAGALLYPLPNR